MAVWQCSMHLVPRSQLAAVCPDMKTPLVGDVFDETSWWCDSQPPDDLPERLSAVLREVSSSDPECRQWGPSPTNTVAVHYTDGRVDEIHARLDLREFDSELVEVLAALATDADGWWIGGDAKQRIPIGRTREAITGAVRASDAARFVADPRAFLEGIDPKRGWEDW